MTRLCSPRAPGARLRGMAGTDRPVFSSRARVVFDALRVAPGAVEDLVRETRLPERAVMAALAELREAGRAEQSRSGRWRAK